jgi:hypothetical protein
MTKLRKAQEFGYDSTWSEVEQILDDFHPRGRLQRFEHFEFFLKIQKNFGVMGVILINNLMKDSKLPEKLIFEGQEIKNCLESKEEERIRYALYILLNNILICFRTLKN